MKICCVFNYKPLYRYPIYKEMDEQLNCDFYFGDFVNQPIKQFPPENLGGYKKIFHTFNIFFEYFTFN